MGPVQAILSSVLSIFFYAMLVAAVWKLFQIGTDLGEIKTILTGLRRDTGNPAVTPVLAGPISLESAEALLREVAAESQALAAEGPKTTV